MKTFTRCICIYLLIELAPENSKQKIIACPNCMHSFPITVTGGNGEQDSVQETVSNKRKGYGTVNELMIKVCLKILFLMKIWN